MRPWAFKQANIVLWFLKKKIDKLLRFGLVKYAFKYKMVSIYN